MLLKRRRAVNLRRKWMRKMCGSDSIGLNVRASHGSTHSPSWQSRRTVLALSSATTRGRPSNLGKTEPLPLTSNHRKYAMSCDIELAHFRRVYLTHEGLCRRFG